MSDTPIFDNVNKGQPETDKTPQPKVVAATSGAAVGTALAVVVCWIVEAVSGVDIPSAVEGAAAVIFGTGVAFLGGYYKKG